MIALTEEECQAVRNDEAVVVPSPELGENLVVLRAKHLELIREALADQQEQKAVLNYSMKQAAKVARQDPY
jgi:hypothetical protein